MIDMHINAYDDQHFFVSKDVYGKKSPANATDHFGATYSTMQDLNVVKGVVANETNAINMHRRSDKDGRIIWGTGMVFPKVTDIKTFERKIQTGEINLMGEMPPLYHKYSVNHPDFAPYLELCEKYDVPVAIHLGTERMNAQYSGLKDARLAETTVGKLGALLKEHPSLKVHLVHSGEVYTYYHELIALMAKNENVYVSMGGVLWTHPTVREYSGEFLKLAKEEKVLDQVMFGSGQGYFPHGITFSVNFLNKFAFLTKEEKRDIFYNNAARFLDLEEENFVAVNNR